MLTSCCRSTLVVVSVCSKSSAVGSQCKPIRPRVLVRHPTTHEPPRMSLPADPSHSAHHAARRARSRGQPSSLAEYSKPAAEWRGGATIGRCQPALAKNTVIAGRRTAGSAGEAKRSTVIASKGTAWSAGEAREKRCRSGPRCFTFAVVASRPQVGVATGFDLAGTCTCHSEGRSPEESCSGFDEADKDDASLRSA